MTKHVPGRTKPAVVWKTVGVPAPDSKEAAMVRVQLSFDGATRGSAVPPSRAGEAEFCLLQVPEGPALSLAAPKRSQRGEGCGTRRLMGKPTKLFLMLRL